MVFTMAGASTARAARIKTSLMFFVFLGALHAASGQAPNTSIAPAVSSTAANRSNFAPFDGKGNHIDNPSWGAANTPLIRHPINTTGYSAPNGSVMAGGGRPSPRNISLALIASPYIKRRDESRATNLVAVVGQYATADITKVLTINTTDANASAPIPVPPGDPFMSNFTDNGTVSPLATRTAMKFKRSVFTVDSAGVRQQVNSVTSFVDASTVYGSSQAAARRLRAGSGGLLKDDGNRGLPFNEDPNLNQGKIANISNDAHAVPNTRLRAAGFGTVNQHPGFLSLATIWLREHNRRAAEAIRLNPSFGDEEAFQYARKFVMAHVSHMVYDEYLPVLLGTILPAYVGYNASMNPSMDNFFAAAAYRYGHATITDVVYRLDEKWQQHSQGNLLLSDVWFQPDKALSAGIEPLIRGYVASPRGVVEPRFSAAVQQNLFGPSNINGSDLFSINIQRGRDHGLPDYNTCRTMFGLPPVTSFPDITPDAELAASLEHLYNGNISNVDAYVGGLAEPHYGNAHVGQLFFSSIFDQFHRLRDGDWWYYKNTANGLFNAQETAEIDSTNLRDIILRNTNITELPDNIWTLSEDTLLGVCPAGTSGMATSSTSASGAALAAAGGSGGANASTIAGPFKLLGGVIELTIFKTSDPNKIRVQEVGHFDRGFMGFGVPKADQPVGQKMVGADMVISRIVDGQPSVLDYHAIGHVPPILDTDDGGKNDVTLISYQRSGGTTVSVFERPLVASDSNGLDNPVLLDGPNTFIVSHGQDDSLNYHGIDNRAVLELPGSLFGSDANSAIITTATDPTALKLRYQHGTLMAVNFVLVFPLGALIARQLRARWLSSLAVKAVLFYLHITVQMCGVAMATAGFIIAKSQFGVPYQQVFMSHGMLGISVLTLIYSQLLIGFIRPPAASDAARSLWQLVHAMFGRSVLMLGVINVFIGIYLLSTLYKANIAVWGGLCAASLGAIALLQSLGDLLERRASEELAAQVEHTPDTAGGKPPPPTGPSKQMARVDSDDLHDDPGIARGSGGYSPDPTDQIKPYQPPVGPYSGAHLGGFGGNIIGISPVGGSGKGRGLYWGPAPAHGQYGGTDDYYSAGGTAAGQHGRQYNVGTAGADEEHGAAQHASFTSDSSHRPIYEPIVRTISNTFGTMGTLLRRSTSREPPQLPLNPDSMAPDPNNTAFCDYETAGVYNPCGEFRAACQSRKSPVQEIHLPTGLDQGLGLPYGTGAAPLNRRHSAGSDASSTTSSSNAKRTWSGASGGTNWRSAAAAAAAAAAQQVNAASTRTHGGSSAFAAESGMMPAAGRPGSNAAATAAAAGAPGGSLAVKLAAAKAGLKGPHINYAATTPSTSTFESAGSGDGSSSAAGSGSGPTRLSASLLEKHNRPPDAAAAGRRVQQQQQQQPPLQEELIDTDEETDGLGPIPIPAQHSSPGRMNKAARYKPNGRMM